MFGKTWRTKNKSSKIKKEAMENKPKKVKVNKENNSSTNIKPKKYILKNVFSGIGKFIKKRYKLLMIIALVIISIIATILFLDYRYNKKYEYYTKKMETYGFDKLYNNSSAKASEKVTNSEAIKLILGSLYNTYNIDYYGTYNTNGEYENNNWVSYAIMENILGKDEITEENHNKVINFIDMLGYYLKARSVVIEVPVKADKISNFKDLGKYTSQEQLYINDATTNKLIENSTAKLNGRKQLKKGEFNKLIVTMVEQYNLITIDGGKININKDKIPSNANIYPYTLSDVDKSVYEIPLYTPETNRYIDPISVYRVRKELYGQIKDKVQAYINGILNIDYNTITAEELIQKLSDSSYYRITTEEAQEYVDYVKSNKIKISGDSSVQLPALYYDGTYYRVRTKVEFNIENADLKENLLFSDLRDSTKVEYSKDKYSLVLDVPTSFTMNSLSLYVVNIENVKNMIAGSVNQGSL